MILDAFELLARWGRASSSFGSPPSRAARTPSAAGSPTSHANRTASAAGSPTSHANRTASAAGSPALRADRTPSDDGPAAEGTLAVIGCGRTPGASGPPHPYRWPLLSGWSWALSRIRGDRGWANRHR
ncbi:hypothetical protein Aca07nite_65810 [Actinoplanes capillaceus]|uniref:Uncharacterized protein n=1 Tax=Actinoplanes campanulatus TaxID=113559 RepID=A0ABQ3WSP7_9ACTN|nr:hypothetical protein Aca07nite_65810 [Actinoplanes capillaceus]